MKECLTQMSLQIAISIVTLLLIFRTSSSMIPSRHCRIFTFTKVRFPFRHFQLAKGNGTCFILQLLNSTSLKGARQQLLYTLTSTMQSFKCSVQYSQQPISIRHHSMRAVTIYILSTLTSSMISSSHLDRHLSTMWMS